MNASAFESNWLKTFLASLVIVRTVKRVMYSSNMSKN